MKNVIIEPALCITCIPCSSHHSEWCVEQVCCVLAVYSVTVCGVYIRCAVFTCITSKHTGQQATKSAFSLMLRPDGRSVGLMYLVHTVTSVKLSIVVITDSRLLDMVLTSSTFMEWRNGGDDHTQATQPA